MAGYHDRETESIRVVTALLRLHIFRDMNIYQLQQLAQRAVPAVFEPDEAVLPDDPDHSGDAYFLLVVSGELDVVFPSQGHVEGTRQVSLLPGDCFGELSVITGRPMDNRVVARQFSRVLFFFKQDFDDLFRSSAAFRRGVLDGWEYMAGPELEQLVDARPQDLPMAHAELVRVQQAPRTTPLPVDACAVLLAMAVARQFGSRVLTLRLVPDGWQAQGSPDGEQDGLVLQTVPAGSLAHALAQHSPHFEYIFVLSSRGDAGLREEIAAATADATRVCLWTGPPDMHEAPPGTEVPPACLETVLLPRNWRREPRRFRLKPVPLSESTGLAVGTPRLECRLTLDWRAAGHAWSTRGLAGLAELSTRQRATLARWARALTGRTTGVALGGGGAWGYYNVALLKLLDEAEVPIDVISGSSFGAVVGAYYAVKGVRGLDRLVARGKTMRDTSWVSLVTTWRLQQVVAEDLGRVQLENLPVLFHPYATNLSRTRGSVLVGGPLPLAVRASSSAPGLFGPTVLPGLGRFVDGCVVDNVPTNVLFARSAALRFAANVYPPPERRPARDYGPLTPLTQLNLVGRLFDAVASGGLMLHVAGERQCLTASVAFDAHWEERLDPMEAQRRQEWMDAASFADAKRIVERAMEDALLQEKVEAFARMWENLKQSQGGSSAAQGP